MAQKDLPEILETEVNERDNLVVWLERAWDLNVQIKNMEADLSKIKEVLAVAQMEHELDGIRHNKLVFVNRWQEGRESLDTQKFFQELVSHGVKTEIIQEAAKAATKKGEPFYVKDLKMLK